MFRKMIKMMLIASTIILLSTGAYFTYKEWQKYQLDSTMHMKFKQLKMLQSLEYAWMHELVCKITGHNNNALEKDLCLSPSSETDTIVDSILSQQEEQSLHVLSDMLQSSREEIGNFDTHDMVNLLNGELTQAMHTFIEAYILEMKSLSDDMHQREYLHYYNGILNRIYHTEIENAFISHTLTLKRPISNDSLKSWDKLIEKVHIPSSYRYALSFLHPDIEQILKEENLQDTLDNIKSIRLGMMSYAVSGKYTSEVPLWMALVNHKVKVLEDIGNLLLMYMREDMVKVFIRSKSIVFLASVILFLIMLAFFLFMLYFYLSINKRKILRKLLLSVDKYSETSNNLKINDEFLSYQIAYDYIAMQYESISRQITRYKDENFAMKKFLHSRAYEIRTPMNGLLGYTKLLKATGLSIEQKDLIIPLDHNIENLETILGKIGTEACWQEYHSELMSKPFDLVNKIESTVETFATRMDEKDILLSLYIEPALFYEVRGDSSKISQVMTNLIENALATSNAYDMIDVLLRKINADEDSLTIEFSVRDYSMGYSDEKISRIYDALTHQEATSTIVNLDMQNLHMSNKILEQMGSTLEVKSQKGDGSLFLFTLHLVKTQKNSFLLEYPKFKNISVGIVLPHKDIYRQVDKNIERYVSHLGARVQRYDYATLLDDTNKAPLPDLLFIYHNYARIGDELTKLSLLDCKVALLTSGTLRSSLEKDKNNFSSIAYTPITLKKIVRIFTESDLLVNEASKEENIDTWNAKKNLYPHVTALVADDNEVVQRTLRYILEIYGIEVAVVSKSREVLSLRKKRNFDLLFIDIEMPMVDGVDVISSVISYERKYKITPIPIIALSTEEEKLRYEGIEVSDWISKPMYVKQIDLLLKKYCKIA